MKNLIVLSLIEPICTARYHINNRYISELLITQLVHLSSICYPEYPSDDDIYVCFENYIKKYDLNHLGENIFLMIEVDIERILNHSYSYLDRMFVYDKHQYIFYKFLSDYTVMYINKSEIGLMGDLQ